MKKLLLAFACLAILASPATAQDFPTKPIKIIVPFPAGAGTDVVSRLYGQQLSEMWKQPIVVENKPGANTIIGSEFVAKSPGDGYTWLIVSPSHTINASLYAKTIPYNTERDFQATTMLASAPLVLVVHPSVQASNVTEFIEFIRKNPGKILYGSAGSGSSPHIAGVMFTQIAGVNMDHVPYKGTAPSIADLLGNHIQATFTPLPGVEQHIKSGKLRALAVTTDKRYPGLPNLPTMMESGLKDYNISQWWGIAVPKNTPKSTIDKIDADVQAIQKRPEIQQKLQAIGAQTASASPTQLEQHIRKEIAAYRTLVERARITPD